MHILVAQNASRAKTGGASRVMGFIHEQIEKVGHVVDYLCADDVPTSMQGKFARFTFPLLVRRRSSRFPYRSSRAVVKHETSTRPSGQMEFLI